MIIGPIMPDVAVCMRVIWTATAEPAVLNLNALIKQKTIASLLIEDYGAWNHLTPLPKVTRRHPQRNGGFLYKI